MVSLFLARPKWSLRVVCSVSVCTYQKHNFIFGMEMYIFYMVHTLVVFLLYAPEKDWHSFLWEPSGCSPLSMSSYLLTAFGWNAKEPQQQQKQLRRRWWWWWKLTANKTLLVKITKLPEFSYSANTPPPPVRLFFTITMRKAKCGKSGHCSSSVRQHVNFIWTHIIHFSRTFFSIFLLAGLVEYAVHLLFKQLA